MIGASLDQTTDLRDQLLIFPFRGIDPSDMAVEFKLQDTTGCLASVRFDGAADLPAWRPAIVPVEVFSTVGAGWGGCTLDASQVSAVQVAVSGSDGPAAGTLALDRPRQLDWDTAAAPGLDHQVCAAHPDDAELAEVRSRIVADFLERQQAAQTELGHALIPAWFEESPARYYLYSESLALMVLSRHSVDTGDADAGAGADALAQTLLDAPRRSDDTWPDFWTDGGSGLATDDNPTTWEGNIAWGLLGLASWLEHRAPDDAEALALVQTQADHLVGRQAAYADEGGQSGLLTSGTEGNLSSWFALRAAHGLHPTGGYGDAADTLATAILAHAWDDDHDRFMMGTDDPRLASDVVGNWGSRFLFEDGQPEAARRGLGLSAMLFSVRDWDDSWTGLGDIAGPWQPSTEFTAQHISAGGPGSAALLDALLALEEDGTFPSNPDDFDGGAGWNSAWRGVTPAAWMWLALSGPAP